MSGSKSISDGSLVKVTSRSGKLLSEPVTSRISQCKKSQFSVPKSSSSIVLVLTSSLWLSIIVVVVVVVVVVVAPAAAALVIPLVLGTASVLRVAGTVEVASVLL